MAKKSKRRSWQDDVVSAEVSAEDIEAALAAAEERHREVEESGAEPEPFLGMFAVLGRLARTRPHSVISAIVFRLEAMSALCVQDQIGGWTIKIKGQPYILVHEAVLHATAKATLRLDSRPSFDAEEFARLVIEFAEPEGEA